MALSENNIPKYVFFKPRQTLYEVLFHVRIKDLSTNEWIDGLAYRKVGEQNAQIYTRPFVSFGDKWEIYES